MIFVKPKLIDFYNKNFFNQIIKKINQKISFDNPLHIIFPFLIINNIKEINNFFKSINFDKFKIFFASKSLVSEFFYSYLKKINLNLEVSSFYELNLALRNKNKNIKILTNGPKDEKYLYQSLNNKVIIGINSMSELKFISQKKSDNQILIRLGNLNIKNFSSLNKTRFGIDEDDLESALEIVKKAKLNFIGFSFHIDSTSDDLKKIYLQKSIEYTLIAIKKFNLYPKVINIGGGFRVNYLDKNNWTSIINHIYENLKNKNSNYFWNNYNFGIIEKNNRIFGEGNFYPFFSESSESKQLQNILDLEFENEKIINFLKDFNIELWLEPGRWLLNQLGGSFFKIIEIEKNKIVLNGKNTDIGFNLDILYDPILIKKNKSTNKNYQYQGYFIFGNSCLEEDIFYKRKIFFEKPVDKNDLLYFHNTIAYKMDFFANRLINYKHLPKIFFDENYKLLKIEY